METQDTNHAHSDSTRASDTPDSRQVLPTPPAASGGAANQFERPGMYAQPHQTVVIEQRADSASNGLGIAGFILAIIALFVGWVPFVGWVVWFLGLILSFVGMFKIPRGLAIAGFVVSMIGVILLLVVFGTMAGFAGAIGSAFK